MRGVKTKQEDVVGKKYGRLTVLDLMIKDRRTHCLCKCECGKTALIGYAEIARHHTQSCGCLSVETATKHGKSRHGKENSRLYTVWQSMKARCTNENSKSYNSYGARGITVCDEWVHDFQAFYNWATENGYEDGLTIDRIDVNGNYEPSNCRWATVKEQNRNTRNNVFVEYKGDKRCMTEWAEMMHVPLSTLRLHVRKGDMSDFEKYYEGETA